MSIDYKMIKNHLDTLGKTLGLDQKKTLLTPPTMLLYDGIVDFVTTKEHKPSLLADTEINRIKWLIENLTYLEGMVENEAKRAPTSPIKSEFENAKQQIQHLLKTLKEKKTTPMLPPPGISASIATNAEVTEVKSSLNTEQRRSVSDLLNSLGVELGNPECFTNNARKMVKFDKLEEFRTMCDQGVPLGEALQSLRRNPIVMAGIFSTRTARLVKNLYAEVVAEALEEDAQRRQKLTRF